MQSSPLLNHRRNRIRSAQPVQVNLKGGRSRWKVELRDNGRERRYFEPLPSCILNPILLQDRQTAGQKD